MGIREVLNRPARALAESLRGAGDRLNPPRVPGSFPHPERDSPPPALTRLHRLLQHRAATPIARQQQSPATRRGTRVAPARPRDPPCDRTVSCGGPGSRLGRLFPPMAIVTTAGRDASASHAPSPVRRRREKVGPIWFLTRTPGAPGNHSSRSSSHGAPEVEGGPEDGPVTLPSIGDGVKAMRDSASSKVTQRISAVSASNVPVSLTVSSGSRPCGWSCLLRHRPNHRGSSAAHGAIRRPNVRPA